MAGQVDTSAHQAAAKALRAAADKGMKREYSRALREAGRPLGRQVAAAGAARLPSRRGLAARVAGARVGVQASAMRVTVTLKTREGYDLRAMRRGKLRHPVFGRKAWVRQDVDGGGFDEGFEAGADQVRQAMHDAAQRVLAQITGAVR